MAENLHKAKVNKNDEFYTRMEDISKELSNYKRHFKDKVIFCNCDDPEWSNFWIFFHQSFEAYGLKKLIATHYNADGSPSYVMEYEGGNDVDPKDWHQRQLKGNGDFASEECIELLNQCDIVITNPPFSKFREYISLLMKHDKKFIIIGNKNAITYKEFFPLLKDNKVWEGYNMVKEFLKPDGTYQKFGNIGWFTNLDIPKRHESLIDTLRYQYDKHPELYQKYDNYDAINVDKIKDIPYDYYGVMGVPITFMDKYNPKEFEIVGLAPERLKEGESSLQIKRYANAIQNNKNGTICSGNKVNDGPTLLHNSIPNKFPYYISETVPGKFIEVLYARVLIKRKNV